MNVQSIITGVLILGAAGYLLWTGWRSWRAKKAGACGGCGCSKPKPSPNPSVVSLGLQRLEHRDAPG